MFNLLSEKEIKQAKGEYTRRRLIVIFWFMALTSIILITSLVPAYVMTAFKVKDLQATTDILKQSIAVKNQEDANEFILLTNKKIASMSGKSSSSTPYLLSITTHKSPDIQLTGFTVVVGPLPKSKEVVTTIKVDGVAKNREVLMGFASRLRSDPLYSQVELPISNFAAETNIRFTITAIAK